MKTDIFQAAYVYLVISSIVVQGSWATPNSLRDGGSTTRKLSSALNPCTHVDCPGDQICFPATGDTDEVTECRDVYVCSNYTDCRDDQICVDTGFTPEVECQCPQDHFEFNDTALCVSIEQYFLELKAKDDTLEKEPELIVQFMNDGNGEEITLTLFKNNVTELWSSSCSGASCTVTGKLSASDLVCEDLYVQLSVVGNETLLATPAFINVTFDDVSVVFEGTPTHGIRNRMMTFVAIGKHLFSCEGALPSTPTGKTAFANETTPEKSEIEVQFMNAGDGDEATLTLLKNNTTSLWSGSCSDAFCGITSNLVLADLACEELSLVVKVTGNETLLSAPAFLNVTFNKVSAIFKGTPQHGGAKNKMMKFVQAGVYNFMCKTVKAKAKPKSKFDIYFRNDEGSGDRNLTLLFNKTTEFWSSSCNESACEIVGLVNLSNDIECEGLSLQIATANNSSLTTPAVLNVSFNDAVAVLEETNSDGLSSREVKSINPGIYNFSCADVAAAKKSLDTAPKKSTVQVKFVNDASGRPTLLALLNGDVEVWNDICYGQSCGINTTVEDAGLICDDMKLKIVHFNDLNFTETAEVTVTFNTVQVVYEIHDFSPGVFNFTCDNPVKGS
jgi:hypothetical protein